MYSNRPLLNHHSGVLFSSMLLMFFILYGVPGSSETFSKMKRIISIIFIIIFLENAPAVRQVSWKLINFCITDKQICSESLTWDRLLTEITHYVTLEEECGGKIMVEGKMRENYKSSTGEKESFPRHRRSNFSFSFDERPCWRRNTVPNDQKVIKTHTHSVICCITSVAV